MYFSGPRCKLGGTSESNFFSAGARARIGVNPLSCDTGHVQHPGSSEHPISGSQQLRSTGHCAICAHLTALEILEEQSFQASLDHVQGGHAALVGALRREEAASRSIKRLEGELEGVRDVLRQRDMDAQRTKMIIRLKEDKIARLQACLYLALQ